MAQRRQREQWCHSNSSSIKVEQGATAGWCWLDHGIVEEAVVIVASWLSSLAMSGLVVVTNTQGYRSSREGGGGDDEGKEGLDHKRLRLSLILSQNALRVLLV
ncbi:hypothetical protein NL676_021104 [Syzygium grande]|nr:hypothetical protein NL676_021104 [Syzygium grande]